MTGFDSDLPRLFSRCHELSSDPLLPLGATMLFNFKKTKTYKRAKKKRKRLEKERERLLAEQEQLRAEQKALHPDPNPR